MDHRQRSTPKRAEEMIIEALASRKTDHGGIPVGALILPKQHLAQCRSRIEQLAGLSKYQVDRLAADLFLLHLPPLVAGVLDSPSAAAPDMYESLAAIITQCSATYCSGVRVRDTLLSRPLPLLPAAGPGLGGEESRACFRFAEIFAGIGGFRLALEPLGGRCVLAAEIDLAARSTYHANWPDAGEQVGDIVGVQTAQMAPMDMLTAGFPCQPFSERGRLPGLLDGRGQLYRELVRILRAHQPACFLFENVPGLVTMAGGTRGGSVAERRACSSVVEPVHHFTPGRTFEELLEAFAACGYCVTWRVISARHWLPQHRERVYIVGFRADLRLEMAWDQVRAHGIASTLREILEPSGSDAVSSCELSHAQWATVQRHNEAHPRWGGLPCTMAERSADLDAKHPTLTASYHHVSNYSTKFVCEEADGTPRDGAQLRPRFLTPRECARLMGFPDNVVIPRPVDAQAVGRFYHQIGNAACPPVLQAIATVMVRSLRWVQQQRELTTSCTTCDP